jgi:hypothetical protein
MGSTTTFIVAADWHVTIDGVYGNSIDFGTGDDLGASMKIEIFDVCRVDSATRQAFGELYPGDNVYGMQLDYSAIVNDPGCCNKVIYNFLPQINQTNMYTDNGDNTATIAFCAQIALYDGGSLINLAEVKAQYIMQLPAGDISLDTYTITDAAGFTDADDSGLSFDGSLYAYFCDPNTHAFVDYGVTGQGTVLSVCFQVADGQFEIKDVMDLNIESADGYGPTQTIISSSSVVEDTIALKTCYDNSNSDANVCVVQFLLKHEFYETSAITLTGSGTLLLELGDSYARKLLGRTALSASPSRRAEIPGRRLEASQEGHFMTAPYRVKASRFFIDEETINLTRSSEPTLNNVIFAVIIVACILACCVGTGLFTNRFFLENKKVEKAENVKEEKNPPAEPTAGMVDDSAVQREVAQPNTQVGVPELEIAVPELERSLYEV